MRAFFCDTWAFIALANSSDPAHDVAVEVDRKLERDGWVGVTSDYVFDETLTFLNAVAGARAAVGFSDAFLERVAAGELQLLDVGPARRDAAIALFRKLAPEERRLSFTDATSFALMHELAIAHAFTADAHFHRAGRGVRPLVSAKAGRFVAARF
jgi:predicted nucleic acid-binding protein